MGKGGPPAGAGSQRSSAAAPRRLARLALLRSRWMMAGSRWCRYSMPLAASRAWGRKRGGAARQHYGIKGSGEGGRHAAALHRPPPPAAPLPQHAVHLQSPRPATINSCTIPAHHCQAARPGELRCLGWVPAPRTQHVGERALPRGGRAHGEGSQAPASSRHPNTARAARPAAAGGSRAPRRSCMHAGPL